MLNSRVGGWCGQRCSSHSRRRSRHCPCDAIEHGAELTDESVKGCDVAPDWAKMMAPSRAAMMTRARLSERSTGTPRSIRLSESGSSHLSNARRSASRTACYWRPYLPWQQRAGTRRRTSRLRSRRQPSTIAASRALGVRDLSSRRFRRTSCAVMSPAHRSASETISSSRPENSAGANLEGALGLGHDLSHTGPRDTLAPDELRRSAHHPIVWRKLTRMRSFDRRHKTSQPPWSEARA